MAGDQTETVDIRKEVLTPLGSSGTNNMPTRQTGAVMAYCGQAPSSAPCKGTNVTSDPDLTAHLSQTSKTDATSN